jgi:uncharacterized protein YjbI with pentapeptide repeats
MGLALTWIPFACVGLALAVFIALAYWRGWGWAGFAETPTKKKVDGKDVQPAKTLWDWLQLLVIPLALAGLAFLLNNAQSNREQQREDQRAASQREIARDASREKTLRAYLTQMSDLILDRNLRRSRLGDNVQAVARTATLTALRRVDGERKGVVVRFLNEAHLLLRDVDGDPKVDLYRANLRSADLREAHLEKATLRDADLEGAHLQGASLWKAMLAGADLRKAHMQSAILDRANLLSADLVRANLQSAFLVGAFLVGADLRHARLRGADLTKAEYTSSTRWPPHFDPVAAGARKWHP